MAGTIYLLLVYPLNDPMKKWLRPALFILTLCALVTPSWIRAADKKFTVALIPGLTSDAFYITMHRGAQAAADALGVDLIFQGPSEWNAVQQVPVLNAIIGRKPDAILLVATDRTQLIEPCKKAFDQGIPILCLDCAIGNGRYQ